MTAKSNQNSSLDGLLKAAEEALADGRFEEGVELLQQAVNRRGLSVEREALIRCRLSQGLEWLGSNTEQLEAIAKYDSEVAIRQLSHETRLQVLLRLGWGYSLNNDLPTAIGHFNRVIKLALSDDSSTVGLAYLGVGRAYVAITEIKFGRECYEKALDLFMKCGDWRAVAETHIWLSAADLREGRFQNALVAAKKATSILAKHNDPYLLARAFVNIGVVYDNIDETDSFIDRYERSIGLIKDNYHLGVYYSNFALRLTGLGQWPRAEQMFFAALATLEKTSRILTYGAACDSFAQLYLIWGRIAEADQLMGQTLNRIGSFVGAEAAKADILVTMARSSLSKGNPQRAVEEIEQAIELWLKRGHAYYISEAKLWLTEAKLQMGHLAEARTILEAVRTDLLDSMRVAPWGLLMRQFAKLEFAEDQVEASLQSLSQSTSVFEMRGEVHSLAVNRLILADILRKIGRSAEALKAAQAALEVFERLGATLDERKALDLLVALRENPVPSANSIVEPTPSLVNDRNATRLALAAISPKLLFHELAEISRDLTNSAAAIICESGIDGLTVVASSQFDKDQQRYAMAFIQQLAISDYGANSVYRINDGRGSRYLLHLSKPRDENFTVGKVKLDGLLLLATQALKSILGQSPELRTWKRELPLQAAETVLPGFISASPAMQQLLEEIEKIRSSNITVLITGESGTGKELIAKALHVGSQRASKPFIAFNCASTSPELAESLLFGHRKGSFTGAIGDYEGQIRAAEGGSLFLDEIAELPLLVQSKLLRFLQEGEIQPVGQSKPLKVDVRVIAATNANLEQAVAEKKFRLDLFYRLNVIRLNVPPLRERRMEVPLLLDHYLELYQEPARKSGIRLSEEAVDLLVIHDWPGNVRELCNEVQRIVTYCTSDTLVGPQHLSAEIVRRRPNLSNRSDDHRVVTGDIISGSKTLAEATAELEKQMIKAALARTKGNITAAARELGLSRSTFYTKLGAINLLDNSLAGHLEIEN